MIPFVKMHGHGNDFVIFEANQLPEKFDEKRIVNIAHRRFGIGCDQLIILHQSKIADALMQIFNADGSEVKACGNATRCVTYLMGQRLEKSDILIETPSGIVKGVAKGMSDVSIVLPPVQCDVDKVPLTRSLTADDFPELRQLRDPVGINVGNPHIVFYPDPSQNQITLEEFGKRLNAKHPLIPEGTNIEWVQVYHRKHLQVKVYERGVGPTLSCGTGACASVAVGALYGINDMECTVTLEGGDLHIRVNEDKSLVLTGPVCYVCEGQTYL